MKPLRERIREGLVSFGVHVANDLSPKTALRLAQTGLDFVFIDTEHTPLDRETVSRMCHFYAANGVSPAVRVPYPNPHWISMAMDGGAHGIVVPYIESVEETTDIARAVSLRPLKGQRAKEHQSGEKPINPNTLDYLKQWNRDNYLTIGVESVHAVENLDSLMGIENVSGVFIGPHDLSVSMEIPEEFDNPKYLKTVETIITKTHAAGLISGMHIKPETVPLERLRRWMAMGLNWIVYSSDSDILVHTLQARLTEMRISIDG